MHLPWMLASPQFPVDILVVQKGTFYLDWSFNYSHLLSGPAPVLKELVCLWGFLFFNHGVFLLVVGFNRLKQ